MLLQGNLTIIQILTRLFLCGDIKGILRSRTEASGFELLFLLLLHE